MEEISIRLFEGAYALKPKADRRMMMLAGIAMLLQLSLLLYLVTFKVFATELVVVFLLSLLGPVYFFFTLWLDHRPQYRRHLTLSPTGVRYRTRFMQPEHEFDWEEVDTVKLELFKIIFVLKNEEVYEVSLEHIQNDVVLQQVKEQVQQMAQLKNLELH
ncbi:hypothetical protein POKO110462_20840 [Pontibacter korlensis]|uniref:YcxB-like protein domain-containing protein n=1 Tax=Pontibacter korlensis TaxID=400092 RepID=A0A0E3ZDD0_9BACT|nr:hypothetical protein [Pontibacter korlensis]AKD02199.1 hypothetical protein PKOR_02435 [Pontibacter korlensis]